MKEEKVYHFCWFLGFVLLIVFIKVKEGIILELKIIH
jgi:hypothetical protein